MKNKMMNLNLLMIGTSILTSIILNINTVNASEGLGCQVRKNNICMIVNTNGRETVYYGLFGRIEIR